MYFQVMSGVLRGLEPVCVSVETDISEGMPMIDLVGYLGSEVKEARERVRSAFRNSGYVLPAKRITINLSPAGIRKSGTGFDLPIALSLLACMGEIPPDAMEGLFAMGELCLDGTVTPVPGVLPMTLAAADWGAGRCLVPAANSSEAGIAEGISVLPVQSLREAVEYLAGRRTIEPVVTDLQEMLQGAGAAEGNDFSTRQGAGAAEGNDFSALQGQPGLRRGMEIAAAGLHNILMTGVPGSGKTMAASCLPTILPGLTVQESKELSAIYSVSGLLPPSGVITRRPFVAPHHTSTAHALTGGGIRLAPGAVTLAHRGVLFLDELPEFHRETLEVLRQPLEEHRVHLLRFGYACTYPADFLFVAAMNPCRCGYYPDRSRCGCSEADVRRYQGRISGPLLDRIDLCLRVEPVDRERLLHPKREESSARIRERVMRAREIMLGRQGIPNGRMDARLTKQVCALGRAAESLLEEAMGRFDLSARAYYRILRTARTIADLEGSTDIEERHLAEAIGYRLAE